MTLVSSYWYLLAEAHGCATWATWAALGWRRVGQTSNGTTRAGLQRPAAFFLSSFHPALRLGGQKGENNCRDVLQLLDLLFTGSSRGAKCKYVRTYIPDRRGLRRIVTQFDIDHVLVISSLFFSRPARLGLALIVREFIFSWRLIQPTLTLEHDVWISYTSKSSSAPSRAKITLASFIISASLAASRFACRSVADDDVSENKSLSMSRLPMSLSTKNRFQSTQYT